MLIEKIKTFIKNYDYHFYIVMKGAFFNVFTNIFGSLASLLSSLLIAKYFGSSVLGTLAILSAIFTIASLISNFGFSQLIVRLIPEYRQKFGIQSAYNLYHQIRNIHFFLTLLVLIIYFVLIHWIEIIFFKDSPYPIHLILLLGLIVIPLNATYVFNLQAIRSLKKLLSYNILEVAPRFLFLLLLSFAIFFQSNPATIIYAKLLGNVLSGLLAIYLLRKVWKFLKISDLSSMESRVKSNDLIKMASPFFLINFLYFLMSQIDTLMMGSMLDENAVGIYQIAIKLTAIISFVIQGVLLFSGPLLSELYASKDFIKLEHFIKRITRVLFLISLPLYLFIFRYGEQILSYFGKEFENGYLALIIMITSQLVLTWYALVSVFLKMTGYQVQLSKLIFLSVLINIVMNIILIPKLGINGAAVASLFSTLFWNILSSHFIYKKYGFKMFPN